MCLMLKDLVELTLVLEQTKLPEIWKAAYAPDDPKAEPKPFTLWRVPIDPANPTADARVSVVLMKFLRAKYVLAPSRRRVLG